MLSAEGRSRCAVPPRTAAASGWRWMPAIAGEAMMAASSATQAPACRAGGNAVDAVLAGRRRYGGRADPFGGDAFALVWHGGVLHGLNGLGASAELTVRGRGHRPAVGDGARSRRLGRTRRSFRRFDSTARCRARPISPRRGRSARIADKRSRAECAPWPGPAPGVAHAAGPARTLRRLASRPRRLHGSVAAALADASWLSEADLAAHRSEWWSAATTTVA
jgi:hypothetical protein